MDGTGYAADDDPIRVGDLVIVEADRGKDLGGFPSASIDGEGDAYAFLSFVGKVVNDSITLGEVEVFWAGQQRFGGCFFILRSLLSSSQHV
jgi:hypothetical protein